MWWIGNDSDDDRQVVGALDRLERLGQPGESELFRGAPAGLLGFGATFREGVRVPLLVVDERRDPRPEFWIHGSGAAARWVRRRLRHRDLPLPPGIDDTRQVAPEPTPRRPTLLAELRLLQAAMSRQRELGSSAGLIERGIGVPLELADERTRAIARRAELPAGTLVSYWPMPKASSAKLRGIPRQPTASAGVYLHVYAGYDDHATAYLATAGHFDVPKAAPVFRSGRWGSRGTLLGTMRVRLDPRRPVPLKRPMAITGAIDLGMIELTGTRGGMRPAFAEVPQHVRDLEVYHWNGAATGQTTGEVVGSLRVIEVEGYPLANCWYVSGVSRRGDSGAAVLHRASGLVLGQIVGSRGGDASGGRRTGTVVQDITLLTDAAEAALDGGVAGLEVADPL
jgi:hypothetical protein